MKAAGEGAPGPECRRQPGRWEPLDRNRICTMVPRISADQMAVVCGGGVARFTDIG